MIKKTIKFENYNGVMVEEDHYFNLSKPELLKMELSHKGGLKEYIDRIVKAEDTVEIVKVFDEIIEKSYGVKSEDGMRFIKDPEKYKEFKESEAYSELFMEIATDADKAVAFMNGIVPKNMNN